MPALAKSSVGSLSGTSDELLHHAVAAVLEVAQESAADLVGAVSSLRSLTAVPLAAVFVRVQASSSTGSRPSRASLHRRPQGREARAHEVGGIPPPQQERPQLRTRRAGSSAVALPPVAAGEAVQGLRLGHVRQGLAQPASRPPPGRRPAGAARRGCGGGPGRGAASGSARTPRRSAASSRARSRLAGARTAASTSASEWPARTSARRSSPSA